MTPKTDPAKWWLLGKPRQRLDIPNKVNGSAQYAIDTRVPGMVYAAVKASPVPWGTLKSYNFDAIKDRPGVIAAVRLKAVPGKRDQPDLQDAVAVVADSWYRAKTALELLPVEWEFGDSAKASSAANISPVGPPPAITTACFVVFVMAVTVRHAPGLAASPGVWHKPELGRDGSGAAIIFRARLSSFMTQKTSTSLA